MLELSPGVPKLSWTFCECMSQPYCCQSSFEWGSLLRVNETSCTVLSDLWTPNSKPGPPTISCIDTKYLLSQNISSNDLRNGHSPSWNMSTSFAFCYCSPTWYVSVRELGVTILRSLLNHAVRHSRKLLGMERYQIILRVGCLRHIRCYCACYLLVELVIN